MTQTADTAQELERLRQLLGQLEVLRAEMRHRYDEFAPELERIHPRHRQSAANLVDYLTLRDFDLREVQEALAEIGLSSMGRAEEHVISTLERVIDNLHVLIGEPVAFRTEAAVGFQEGRHTLTENASALLGPSRPGRPARILVTMPSEAAHDYALVEGLLTSGMDCARINCSHDTAAEWSAMIENIRRAAHEARRDCPILMDLPGPKLRTGPIVAGPRVLRLSPRRDDWGRVVDPARAVLVGDERVVGPLGDVPLIPMPRTWLATLRPGDRIDLVDTRGAHRRAEVEFVTEVGWWVRFSDTTYLATGTLLVAPGLREARVGELPEIAQALRLRVGEVLTLTDDLTPVPATGSRIGCTLGAALEAVHVGDRVLFDDGKIGASVVECRPGEVDVRITTAAAGGTKLRAEKGINLPDTALPAGAITAEDEVTLDFVAAHADIVALSFVNSPDDVRSLLEHLSRRGRGEMGIVLKIETVRGFERLPDILLAAMAAERVGVMVARGDLAVECGFERLAEVQEEILWLSESAHVPVIWATQVLDQMARTGQPSRAEVSDAAMAGRAECVMLNKGPHVAGAVAALDSILRRMDSFQHKKTALLRRLTSWSPEGR